MLRLCLMASHGNPSGFVFHPEQGMGRVSKDYQHLLPSPGLRQDALGSGFLDMRPFQNEEAWKPLIGVLDNDQFVRVDSTLTRPLLVNVQDTSPNSTLYRYGIDKQCTKHEEFKFLMSVSNELERDGLDLSLLSELMGLQAVVVDQPHQPPVPNYRPYFPDAVNSELQLIYPSSEFDFQKPVMDFVGDLVRRSEITVHLDGRVSITSTGTEIKDVLTILAEFYLSKKSTNWRKQTLVPHFNRLDFNEATLNGSSMGLETLTVAPLKSPEKIKFKQSQRKKNNRKTTRERDLYSMNYLHACESILSVMIDKNRTGRAAIPVLKKSGPELPHFLTQFSASIAGTGLAVLFTVICKVASGRVPFCASKLLNTGLGLGLVWLSGAVNRLRDTIVAISKNTGKHGLKEEEMVKNLDSSIKEIYFRAAALIAVVVLRLA